MTLSSPPEGSVCKCYFKSISSLRQGTYLKVNKEEGCRLCWDGTSGKDAAESLPADGAPRLAGTLGAQRTAAGLMRPRAGVFEGHSLGPEPWGARVRKEDKTVAVQACSHPRHRREQGHF